MTAPASLIDVNGIAPSGAPHEPKPAPPLVDPQDLALTAYHESGHAIIARHFGCQVSTASLGRDAAAGDAGRVFWRSASGAGDQRVSTLLVSAAGCAAEQMAGGDTRGRGDSDREMSAPEARSLAAAHGTTLAAIRAAGHREVKKILSDPKVWRCVQSLAAALVDRGTLTGPEIDRVINDAKEATA